MNFKSSSFLLLSLLLAFVTMAQKNPKLKKQDAKIWEKIGEKTVDFKQDRDEIQMNGNIHYEFIKIVVVEAPIYLNNLVISYETGSDQAVEIKSAIKSPGSTKMIALIEPTRELRKISFVYQTIANAMDKKAHLEIFGCKLKPDSKESNLKPKQKVNKGLAIVVSDKTGWQRIVTRVLDTKKGKDEVTVLGTDRFASVKFRMTKGAVNLIETQLEFESGDAQKVQVNQELINGAESNNLTIDGGERRLKKIIFTYKSGLGYFANEAEVEIWGFKSNVENVSN